jgi:coproporphyrinogen III oxidase
VLEDGNLLEKAAANISVVRGTLSPARAQAMSSRGRASIDPAGGQPYSAAALSLVFHAAHPMVPTLRADVRLFQVRFGWRRSITFTLNALMKQWFVGVKKCKCEAMVLGRHEGAIS